MTNIKDILSDNLARIKDRIHETAAKAGRNPESVKLVTVSKTFPAEVVKEAILAGADILGENYIQEARDKIEILSPYPASWHFIGHLQSNKAKYAVRLFDLIHTVDSEKLAAELDNQAAKIDKIQDILIQVNISGEETKSGVSPENCSKLIAGIRHMKHVRIRGFMTMPPFFDEPEKARPYFHALFRLKEDIISEMAGENKNQAAFITELSMGMTGDFEAAVMEGATLVRIGTAIFGGRK